MSILVVAEHDNASIRGLTLNTIAAASQIGGEVHVLVAGYQAGPAAQAASRIAGVGKVLHADGACLGDGLAESLAEQVLAVASGGYSHILFPASTGGKSTAPRVAAKLDVAQISDVLKIVDADTFERPIYAGNAIALVQTDDAVKVLTIRATAFEAAADGGNAEILSVAPVTGGGRTRLLGRELTRNDRPELSAARIIVSGGRALGSKEKFDSVLTPLADRLGAALGASRAAVDAGYAPNDWQVGQTGKIVAPDLYIAVGISGAIQHVAGMRDSKIIVAINKDSEAPIFGIADYSLEADLFAAVPELVNAL